jgi:thioredoxin reductase
MRASTIMAERLLSNGKVKPEWNSVVEEVLGDDERGMTGVRLSLAAAYQAGKAAPPIQKASDNPS